MVTKEISRFLAERPAPGPDWPYRLEELAAAALMVEGARMEGALDDEERDEICRVLTEEFALDQETVECLIGVAEKREEGASREWPFTEAIKKNFDEYERLAVMLKLWAVALADGTLHPFEERLITRIACELGVPGEDVERTREIVLRRRSCISSRTSDALM
jgi:uncharacterized tellurite resistance protein B-like protein